jgi:catechol 2,3-dioxygenase
MNRAASAIDPRATIGHVHLRVADLERATAFYRDVIGFSVKRYDSVVFLGAGDHPHLIALNAGGSPPPPGHTGLHHFAIRFPDKQALARATQRLLDHGHPIDGAQDDAGSLSVYLRDPDGNGIELHYDRPAVELDDPLAERPLAAA